jgi:hypothetical protein
MLANILRDAELLKSVPDVLGPFMQYFEDARRALASGRARRKTVTAAIAHAADFRTWQSLVREGGLTRGQAARLMSALVEAA